MAKCPDCDQPMLPRGAKKLPNEYDHASGCPSDYSTHAGLIRAAARWVERRRYRVVLRDVQCMILGEQPDVIGWKSHGASVLVECKSTRSDFLRDAKKPWRRCPERGMGYERYYAFPEGLHISEDDVRSVGGWGILNVRTSGGGVVVVKKSGPFTRRDERSERTLLVSAVCRVTESWGRKMFGPSAPLGPDGDPPPSTARIIRELRRENERLRRELRDVRLGIGSE